MSRDKYDAIGPSDCNAPWGEWVLAYETAIHQGKIPGSSIDHLPQEDQERVVACRHAVDALREVFGRREDANDEARSVIGDFRPPNIMRFGFSPLYIGFEDIWRAADRVEEILSTESWRDPQYRIRRKVT